MNAQIKTCISQIYLEALTKVLRTQMAKQQKEHSVAKYKVSTTVCTEHFNLQRLHAERATPGVHGTFLVHNHITFL